MIFKHENWFENLLHKMWRFYLYKMPTTVAEREWHIEFIDIQIHLLIPRQY